MVAFEYNDISKLQAQKIYLSSFLSSSRLLASNSLPAEWLKLAGSAVDIDNKLVLGTLLNSSGVDELAHQV